MSPPSCPHSPQTIITLPCIPFLLSPVLIPSFTSLPCLASTHTLFFFPVLSYSLLFLSPPPASTYSSFFLLPIISDLFFLLPPYSSSNFHQHPFPLQSHIVLLPVSLPGLHPISSLSPSHSFNGQGLAGRSLGPHSGKCLHEKLNDKGGKKN